MVAIRVLYRVRISQLIQQFSRSVPDTSEPRERLAVAFLNTKDAKNSVSLEAVALSASDVV